MAETVTVNVSADLLAEHVGKPWQCVAAIESAIATAWDVDSVFVRLVDDANGPKWVAVYVYENHDGSGGAISAELPETACQWLGFLTDVDLRDPQPISFALDECGLRGHAVAELLTAAIREGLDDGAA